MLEGTKDPRKTAEKLHKQFAHPTADKLIALVKKSTMRSKGLEEAIKSVSEACEICLKFKRAPARPVVSIPLAKRFNDVVAIDLKSYDKCYFLVMVDLFSRFCSAVVIPNKMSSTVIKAMFRGWISTFGAPSKILSDNGREFNAEEFQTFAESFNIKLLNTAAESPWSNGVCEKLNGVLGKSVSKIIEDSHCDLETALSWSVSARNALSNFSGFSPNQLVFGYNPSMPNNAQNSPPALEPVESSDVVRRNLAALHSARRTFIQIESDEKLRRALRSNVRMSNLGDIAIGDEVYYKRNGSEKWHGPATVTSVDGKQFMVRHGGNVHRVHVCRLARTPIDPSVANGRTEEKISDRKNDGGTDEQEVASDGDSDVVELDGEMDGEVETEGSAASEEVGVEQSGGTERSDDSDGGVRGEEVAVPATERFEVPAANAAADMRSWKKGERFTGKDPVSGEIVSGQIVSRAGKATGVYRHCYNVARDSGTSGWCDLSTLDDLRQVPPEEELFVFHCSEKVSEAKDREMENWHSNKVFNEVPNVGQKLISTRWVVTEKMKNGNPITKARLVARGFEEDSNLLRKDSPTCSRESVRMLLAIASSKNWSCNLVDIQAAYLQGNPIEREVYLQPPPEYDNGYVWKLKKTVYGLCDAGRAWYLRVKEELLQLGARMCTLDNSLFTWYHDGLLEGAICIYVDDFLWTGTERFEEAVISALRAKLLIGSSGSVAFRYVGLNICSNAEGISVDQAKYIASLEPVKLSRARSVQRDHLLSDSEREAFRALIGQLNWVSNNTRPDIAYDVCELSTLTTQATVADLLRLNKVVKNASEEVVRLFFPRLSELENCMVEVFTDASFAKLSDGGSQGALIVFLKDRNGRRCPLFWQSRRLKRVVKSTLAAETMALLEGAEAAVYIGNILKEILQCKPLKISCITDNKSLVDAVHSTKRVDDKRLRLDIAVLVDMLDRKEISDITWVETHMQLADCMTKKGASTTRLRASITMA